MNWKLCLAETSDISALERLIPVSAHALLKPYYSEAQIKAALGPVFGVDEQLIKDGTYFVARHGDQIIGCGGWSKRAALFGARSDSDSGTNDELDPTREAARIRAFFIHPDWQRRGIGRAILTASEIAMLAAKFRKVELSATLGGEPLYKAFGYREEKRYEIELPGGVALPAVKMTKLLDG